VVDFVSDTTVVRFREKRTFRPDAADSQATNGRSVEYNRVFSNNRAPATKQ